MNRSAYPDSSAALAHRTLALTGVERGNVSKVLAEVEVLAGVHEVTLALGDNRIHLHVNERFDVAALRQIVTRLGVSLTPDTTEAASVQSAKVSGSDARSCCESKNKDGRHGA